MRMSQGTVVSTGFALLAGAILCLQSSTDRAAVRPADQIVGGWRLVSRVTTTPDGKVVVDAGLSATPSGVLIYDHAGHVAAQLSRPGRTVEMLESECRD